MATEPFGGGERERSRGGDEHGGEWEKVEGSACRPRVPPAASREAGGGRRVLARGGRARAILLSKEEEDRGAPGGPGHFCQVRPR